MPQSPSHVVWAPKARQDLEEIGLYYLEQASAEIADKIVRQISHSVRRISERPLMGRSRNELMVGARSILARPYLVFYRVTSDGVQIIRVLHERRNLSAALAEKRGEQ